MHVTPSNCATLLRQSLVIPELSSCSCMSTHQPSVASHVVLQLCPLAASCHCISTKPHDASSCGLGDHGGGEGCGEAGGGRGAVAGGKGGSDGGGDGDRGAGLQFTVTSSIAASPVSPEPRSISKKNPNAPLIETEVAALQASP